MVGGSTKVVRVGVKILKMTKLCKNVHFLLKIATMCKIFKKWYGDKIWVKMVGGPNFGKMVGGLEKW